MNNINVNFNDICGKIKPMHAVNNDKTEAAIIVTHYDDNNDDGEVKLKVNVDGFNNDDGVELEYYIHDENNDMELFRTEIFMGEKYAPVLSLSVQSNVLIKMKKL